MPNQIILSWDVDVSRTTLGPAQAAAALGAVPLYTDPSTDPVLGQLFGLTVAGDSTLLPGGSIARRTLALNMTSGFPPAPPTFPCHTDEPIPATPPFPLRRAVTLPGSFYVTNGILGVATTETQAPSLVPGDTVRFALQPEAEYVVATIFSATQIVPLTPYTGRSGNTSASKLVAAPVTRVAVYSTSDLDTSSVATVPAIAAGSGARSVRLTYRDSTGFQFTSSVNLTGRRPAAITLAGGSIDIAVVVSMLVLSTGGFGNSVGQITLAELSSALPAIPPSATPADFAVLTDEAQALIDKHLAYLPPSYFAVAQQGASSSYLAGDFILTTSSKNVPTTEDQTGALSPGDRIQFVEQLGTSYTVAAVSAKLVQLAAPFKGIDSDNTGIEAIGTRSNTQTKGTVGTEIMKKPSAAILVSSSSLATSPTNSQLSGPLGQFLETAVAAPPPSPPLDPATVPTPTFLSGLFTRTLQLALAVPVTARPITFA